MARRLSVLLVAGLVGLAAPGSGAPPAAAQADTRAGRAAPTATAVVVDALGTVVGPVVAMLAFFPAVRLRADGRDAVMIVLGDRLSSLLPADYESNDCTGPPWVREMLSPLRASLIFEVAAVGRLNELLIANGDPVTRTMNSRWDGFSTPPGCDPLVPAETEIVRPTRVLLDLDTFQPPFRLR